LKICGGERRRYGGAGRKSQKCAANNKIALSPKRKKEPKSQFKRISCLEQPCKSKWIPYVFTHASTFTR